MPPSSVAAQQLANRTMRSAQRKRHFLQPLIRSFWRCHQLMIWPLLRCAAKRKRQPLQPRIRSVCWCHRRCSWRSNRSSNNRGRKRRADARCFVVSAGIVTPRTSERARLGSQGPPQEYPEAAPPGRPSGGPATVDTRQAPSAPLWPLPGARPGQGRRSVSGRGSGLRVPARRRR